MAAGEAFAEDLGCEGYVGGAGEAAEGGGGLFAQAGCWLRYVGGRGCWWG